MPKLELPPSEALYPTPVVLVSCADKKTGRPNVMTIAWCGVVCSKPPMLSVSIRPSRASHKLIKESGNFAVNIPSTDLLKQTDLCGIHSGKDTDKFKLASLTPIPASKISSPIIKECPVNIECVLKDILSLGTHDMFIGEAVAIHADDNVIDSSGRIDCKKAKPFTYNLGEYWDLGKIIGRYGFSAK